MKLKLPLKWHGGKNYLASKIMALMPKHLCYVEPYAGGLSVLLEKNPEGISEVVNDLNGSLINFWNVLRHPDLFLLFQRRIEATPFSEDHFQASVETLRLHEEQARNVSWGNDNNLAWWAVSFFIVCRQSLAGRMKSFAPLSKTRVRRGMNEQVSAWITAIEGLSQVHKRLQRVVIVGPKPAVEVIRQQDGKDTLFYLDPPYLHQTRTTTEDYECEMTEEQHGELLEVLGSIKGKFLLSGYRSDLYDDWASACSWERKEFDLPNNAASGKEKRRMVECVWRNY